MSKITDKQRRELREEEAQREALRKEFRDGDAYYKHIMNSYNEHYSRYLEKQLITARAELKKQAALCDKLAAALEGMMAIIKDSSGVDGYHLNGDIAKWDEFPGVETACAALAEHTKGSRK